MKLTVAVEDHPLWPNWKARLEEFYQGWTIARDINRELVVTFDRDASQATLVPAV